MEKIIHSLINNWIKGVDTYTHNGSTWLIFTESKKWVIELTEQKTLWYNYNFFKQIFEFTSLDVVENQSYITKWVEDNIINGSKNIPSPAQTPSYNLVEVLENGVKEIKSDDFNISQFLCEEVIDKGVKATITSELRSKLTAENIIENGVRDISPMTQYTDWQVEEIIDKGVKKTKGAHMKTVWSVEDTIQNGVKRTQDNPFSMITNVENTIQNGVRHTDIGWHQCNNVDDTIEKGIKETDYKSLLKRGEIEDIIDSGVKHTQERTVTKKWIVDDAIENGVKETNHVDVMKFFDNKMEDTLQNGVKETKVSDYCGNNAEYFITDQYLIDRVLDNGIKETNHIKNNVRETKQFEEHLSGTIDDILENGIKETKQKKNALLILDNSGRELILESHLVIRDGVKETKTPGNGDIASTAEWMKENNSTSYPKMIDDVIENGIKKTLKVENGTFTSIGFDGQCENVIENGVKEIRPSGCVDKKTGIFNYRIQEEVDDVVKNGVKEIKTPNKDGDIKSTLEWMYKNNYQDDYNGSKMINKVIKNGVKVTKNAKGNYTDEVDDVIDNGEKVNGTFVGGKRQKENIESVIGYGTKNPTV